MIVLQDRRPQASAKEALSVAELLTPLVSTSSSASGALSSTDLASALTATPSSHQRGSGKKAMVAATVAQLSSPSVLLPSPPAPTSTHGSGSRASRDRTLQKQGKMYEQVLALPQMQASFAASDDAPLSVDAAPSPSSLFALPSNPFDLVNAHLTASVALQAKESAPTRHLPSARAPIAHTPPSYAPSAHQPRSSAKSHKSSSQRPNKQHKPRK